MQALDSGQEVYGVIMGIQNPKKDDVTWIRVSAVPQFKDGAEKPHEVYATFDDISEQVQYWKALQESESHYRQLFEEMPEAFALHEMLFDEQGTPCDYRFLKVNRMFEKLVDIPAQEIIGHTVRQVFPDLKNAWIERYGKVVLTGQSIEFIDEFKTLDKCFRVKAFRSGENKFIAVFQEWSTKEEEIV